MLSFLRGASYGTIAVCAGVRLTHFLNFLGPSRATSVHNEGWLTAAYQETTAREGARQEPELRAQDVCALYVRSKTHKDDQAGRGFSASSYRVRGRRGKAGGEYQGG